MSHFASQRITVPKLIFISTLFMFVWIGLLAVSEYAEHGVVAREKASLLMGLGAANICFASYYASAACLRNLREKFVEGHDYDDERGLRQ